jgi:hypothetical protein
LTTCGPVNTEVELEAPEIVLINELVIELLLVPGEKGGWDVLEFLEVEFSLPMA